MTFDDITGNGHLWAVRYEGESDNELYKLFDRWNDVIWLRDFFKSNLRDLLLYFGATYYNTAIYDTIEDGGKLETIFMNLSLSANLDAIFRPLSNYMKETYLEKEKAKIAKRRNHASWLRIYAIKLNSGIFIITGGAIKLTATMQEREHTAQELVKIERTRRFLIDNGIVDENGFEDYLNEVEI
jgi:hypothetical protein